MTRLQIKNINTKQSNIRNLIIKAEEEYGSSYKFFANKIDTSCSMFTLWMQGKRNLTVDQLDYLESLLTDKFRYVLSY